MFYVGFEIGNFFLSTHNFFLSHEMFGYSRLCKLSWLCRVGKQTNFFMVTYVSNIDKLYSDYQIYIKLLSFLLYSSFRIIGVCIVYMSKVNR